MSRIAAQRMLRARIILSRLILVVRIILRRRFLARGALHPGRRTGDRGVIRLDRRLVGFARRAARRELADWPGRHVGERIGLADQARQFGQRIALGPCRRMLIVAAIVAIVRGITVGPDIDQPS